MSEWRYSRLQRGRVKARTALDGKAGPVGDNRGRCSPAPPPKPQRTCLIKFLVIPYQRAGRVVGFSPDFLLFFFFFIYTTLKSHTFLEQAENFTGWGGVNELKLKNNPAGNNF